jgi:aldehyde:ferredoxin oxidoreductase
LGIDNNESGWIIAWLMECFEKGILTAEDLGMEMKWGDAEAAKEMLRRISFRQGFGEVLADGIMRAARKIGSEAVNMAVYSQKGNTLRTHDFHVKWFELFDTCVSNTGTIETHDVYLKRKPPWGFHRSMINFHRLKCQHWWQKPKGCRSFWILWQYVVLQPLRNLSCFVIC